MRTSFNTHKHYKSKYSLSAGLNASNLLSRLHNKILFCLDRFFLANGTQKPVFSGFFFKYLLDYTFLSDRFFYLSSISNIDNVSFNTSFFFRVFYNQSFFFFICRNSFLSRNNNSIFKLKNKKKNLKYQKGRFFNKFKNNKGRLFRSISYRQRRVFNLYEHSIINYNKIVFNGRSYFIRHMRNKCLNHNLTFADSLFSNANSSFFSFFNSKFSWYKRNLFFNNKCKSNSFFFFNKNQSQSHIYNLNRLYSDKSLNFLFFRRQQGYMLKKGVYYASIKKNANFSDFYKNKKKYTKYVLNNYGVFRRSVSLLDFYSSFFLSKKWRFYLSTLFYKKKYSYFFFSYLLLRSRSFFFLSRLFKYRNKNANIYLNLKYKFFFFLNKIKNFFFFFNNKIFFYLHCVFFFRRVSFFHYFLKTLKKKTRKNIYYHYFIRFYRYLKRKRFLFHRKSYKLYCFFFLKYSVIHTFSFFFFSILRKFIPFIHKYRSFSLLRNSLYRNGLRFFRRRIKFFLFKWKSNFFCKNIAKYRSLLRSIVIFLRRFSVFLNKIHFFNIINKYNNIRFFFKFKNNNLKKKRIYNIKNIRKRRKNVFTLNNQNIKKPFLNYKFNPLNLKNQTNRYKHFFNILSSSYVDKINRSLITRNLVNKKGIHIKSNVNKQNKYINYKTQHQYSSFWKSNYNNNNITTKNSHINRIKSKSFNNLIQKKKINTFFFNHKSFFLSNNIRLESIGKYFFSKCLSSYFFDSFFRFNFFSFNKVRLNIYGVISPFFFSNFFYSSRSILFSYFFLFNNKTLFFSSFFSLFDSCVFFSSLHDFIFPTYSIRLFYFFFNIHSFFYYFFSFFFFTHFFNVNDSFFSSFSCFFFYSSYGNSYINDNILFDFFNREPFFFFRIIFFYFFFFFSKKKKVSTFLENIRFFYFYSFNSILPFLFHKSFFFSSNSILLYNPFLVSISFFSSFTELTFSFLPFFFSFYSILFFSHNVGFNIHYKNIRLNDRPFIFSTLFFRCFFSMFKLRTFSFFFLSSLKHKYSFFIRSNYNINFLFRDRKMMSSLFFFKLLRFLKKTRKYFSKSRRFFQQKWYHV